MRTSRRRFLALLAAAPLASRAQPAAGTARKVGLLYPGPMEDVTAYLPQFTAQLRALGFTDVIAVPRAADEHFDRLPALARELVDQRVVVIMTVGSPATHAARAASTTIPIVTSLGDPERSGFAASIAKPGGNVTGLSFGLYETARGQVDLLRQFLPRLQRIAIFQRPDMSPETLDVPMDAARDRGLEPKRLTIRTAAEVDEAFRAMPRGPRAGLMPATLRVMENAAVAEVAIRRGVALAGGGDDWAEAGALLGFSLAHRDEGASKMAILAQILRGARAADIPFQLPEAYTLALNQATARALKLSIPDDVRLRATKIVG